MKQLLLLAFVFALCSCTEKTNFAPIEINEQYTLDVPSYMEPAELTENASFEYKCGQRELYAIVVDEKKSTLKGFGLEYDLDTYMKIAMHRIDSTSDVKPVPQKINGLNALHAGLKGEVKNNGQKYNAVYRLTVIETQEHFYQLLIWTMDSWYDRNKADIEHMESSFHERTATETAK